MASRTVRSLRALLSITIALSLAGGGLAVSDEVFTTTYWPNGAEYGRNLLLFGLLCYFLLPDGDEVER